MVRVPPQRTALPGRHALSLVPELVEVAVVRVPLVLAEAQSLASEQEYRITVVVGPRAGGVLDAAEGAEVQILAGAVVDAFAQLLLVEAGEVRRLAADAGAGRGVREVSTLQLALRSRQALFAVQESAFIYALLLATHSRVPLSFIVYIANTSLLVQACSSAYASVPSIKYMSRSLSSPLRHSTHQS